MTSHALCAAGGPQADCSWVKAEESKLPLLSGSALELPYIKLQLLVMMLQYNFLLIKL